jgi:hypothetical protein
MKKVIALFSLSLGLAGCVTVSGTYRITGVTKDGAKIPMVFDVRGSRIYSVRNGICSAHPGATVSIVDLNTRKDLSGESPYKCK